MDLTKLKGTIPETVITQIPDVMNKFQINTSLRLAHFLAQCSHESGGFKVTTENLNYSEERLIKIFLKDLDINRDKILSEDEKRKATILANKPQQIANFVYANQNGNGSEMSGDGWKFRGRGYIQLTGKNNYKAFGVSINEDILSNPDLVSTKYPLLSAAWFFNKNCLTKCDLGSTVDVITNVTKCVNGGTNGLTDRIKEFNKFYSLLR